METPAERTENHAEIKRLRRRARRLRHAGTAGFIGTCIIGACYGIFFGHGAVLAVMGVVMGIAANVAIGLFNAETARRWRKTVERLAETTDTAAISTLIEGIPNQKQSEFKCAMLVEMLPRLKESDAYLLTARHRTILNRLLTTRRYSHITRDSALLIAILKAYEQVGTAAEIPIVTELARGEGRAKKDWRIGQAALDCLPFLEERAAQTKQSQNLLRPSALPTNAPETLLRPASGTNPTDEKQLLRPQSDDGV